MSKANLLRFLLPLALLLPCAALAQAPSITTQPSPQVVATSTGATFTVVASGAATLTYQWQKDTVNLTTSANIASVTAATLTISAATAADVGSYRVVVTNGSGSITSNAVGLAIQAAPTASAATAVSVSGFTANWSAAAGATGYQLDVSTSRTFGTGTFATGYQAIDAGNVTSLAVTGLADNTTYYYRVRPYNATGTGANSTLSATIAVRTQASFATLTGTVLVHDAMATVGSGVLINDNLLPLDANGYFAPTATQAVWFEAGSSSGFTTTQNAYPSISISAGNRAILAYFAPSTTAAPALAIGETLTATLRFKYIDGSGASSVGNFRVGLLNSNGNGTNINVVGATNAQNPARLTSQNFSITGSGSTFARGYSGYIMNSTASTTTPASNPVSFWQRTAATTPASGGTSQILGPTSGDMTSAAVATFAQIGANGGGAAGAIANLGADYVLDLSVTYVSASQVDISSTLKSGSTVIQSHTVSQTTGTLVTSFDTVALFSIFNASPNILDLQVTKRPTATPVAITTPPATQTASIGSNVTLTVATSGSVPITYQWQKQPVGGAFADLSGQTAASLALSNVQASDAGDYRVIVTNAGASFASAAATLTAVAVPATPTASAATGITTGGFTANWATAASATSYRLDVATDSGFGAGTFVSGYQDLDVGNVTTLAVTGLTSGTTYYYRVRGHNTGGDSASSSTITLLTLPSAPSTASGATSITGSAFAAHWGASTGATGYKLDVATSPGFGAGTFVGSYQDLDVSGLSTSVTGLSGNTTYYYRVRALTSTATSASSATAQALTLPSITSQPSTQSVLVGANPSFTVATNNSTGLSYQWKLNSGDISGATTATLSLTNVQLSDSGSSYTVVVTNATGSVTSNPAALTVSAAVLSPFVTVPPATQSVAQGGNVTFSITADGTAPFNYQWQKKPVGGSFADIPSATNSTLTLTNVQPADAGDYRVTLTNSGGSDTSAAGTLTIITAPAAPTATAATSLSTSGFTANWNTVATATGYRLDVSTSPTFASFVTGFNNLDVGNVLTHAVTGLAENTDYYFRVRASNAAGASSSSTAIAATTQLGRPTITTQPSGQSVLLGANVSLSVAATHASSASLTYQWKKDGADLTNSSGHIAGATGASLTLTGALVADAGSYTVVVTNATGSTTSTAATVAVTVPAPTITAQPKDQKALTGSIATFNVIATGVTPLSYQWKKAGSDIVGATSATLTLTNLLAADAGSYTVVVSNSGGSTTSTAAALTVDTKTSTLPAQPVIPAARFSVLDYGATSQSTNGNAGDLRSIASVGTAARRAPLVTATDNAPFIQAAIQAAVTAGGGTVVIPAAAGVYYTGPITLATKINLQIEGGATLRALPYGTYSPASTALITAPSGATDVAITGAGTIYGDGTAWWTADGLASGGITRPRLIQFTRASRVLISGITVQNAPQFHIAFSSGNSDVTLSGVTITAPSSSPNTDGIDYAGTNLLVQNCSISVGDDNIAIKPGSAACSGLTIANCTFGTGHGLSVGGQTNVGLDGMTVTDCTFTGTVSGLRLKADATQGGPVKNLSYSKITMTNVQYPIVFYSYYNEIGNPANPTTPAAVLTRNGQAVGGSAIPTWQNITVSDLTATRTSGAQGYSIIWGLPLADALISGVTLNNVTITGSSGFKIYNATDIQFTGTTTESTLGGLTTANALIVTTQPQTPAGSFNAGDPINLSVAATGTSGVSSTVPTYQWKRNGTAIANGLQANGTVAAGATSATLGLTNTHPGDSGDYTCTVSNGLDGNNAGTVAAGSLPVSATSSAATIAVTGAGTVAVIVTQPKSVSVRLNDPATFTVVATSDTPVTYQWKRGSTLVTNSATISGAQSASLTLHRPQSADAGSYTVVLTNGAGVTTSSAASLRVNILPSLTQQPLDQSVYVGANVTFSVVATGTTPMVYQWKKDGVGLTNGSRIAGATTATLTLTGAQLTDAGAYSVTVTNDAGLLDSAAATLAVAPVPTAPLAPVANAATGVDSGSFLISWNSSLSAAGYLLDVSTTSSFATFVSGYQALDVGINLTRAIAGLKPLTNYYVRVRAYNVVGSSPNSATISVTTLDTSFAPKFTSASGTTFTVGIASDFTVTATGKPTPTIAATGLPSWATFNAATGVLAGTAPAGTANGQFVINFTATNTVAPAAAQVFTLAVQAPPSVTTPMSITTFAGLAGASGATNDTGSAARFNSPAAVALDSASRVYVADTENHILRQISTAGVVIGQAGLAGSAGSANGSATAARFNTPSGVAVDLQGNTFVADTLNHTIRKITAAGSVTTLAGLAGTSGAADGVGNVARFFAPQGIALAPNGTDLYIADTNNHTIRKIDLLNTTVSTIAGLAGQSGSADGTGNGARFNAPSDVAVDKAGNLYVADTDNNTIRTVSAAGAVNTLAGLPGSSGAADGTAGSARFNHPSALVVDGSYNVFVLDTDNHAIRQIVSAAGVVTTVAGQAGAPGSADGSGAAARFHYPAGITLSSAGTFFIADTNNHTIRRGVFANGPTITSQPQGTTVTAGATVQLFVTATGQPAPTYQWLFNGTALSGATSDTLTLASAQPAQSGKYSVAVTNASGTVTSNEATVTINAPPASGGGSSGGGSGGGGGGGAPSTWFYLALLVLAGVRLACSRRASKTVSSSSAS